MASFLSRYGLGLALVVTGLALLGAGAAWSYAHEAQELPASPAASAAERVPGRGLGVDADLGLTGLPGGASLDAPRVQVDPPLAQAAPLPGLSFDRDERVEVAGIALDASLHLKSGSHRDAARTASGDVATQGARQIMVPVAPAVALAAAAFTLAGLLAWLAPSLKKLALPAIGLYAKVSKAEVFDNAVRERIFDAIRQQPGIAASDLSRLAGVSWGTTIYHLDVLEQTQMVTSIRKGRYRRYFENGAILPGTKDAVAILRNPVTATVVATVKNAPGATQKELAGATGMSPQALHWHLTRLVGAGLVRKERVGRVVKHFSVN